MKRATLLRGTIASAVTVALLGVLATSGAAGAQGQFQPKEVLTNTASNLAPMGPALFAPEGNVSIGSSSDAKVVAYASSTGSEIGIKEVGPKNELDFKMVGNTNECIDFIGAESPRISDVSVSGNGKTIVFRSRANNFACTAGVTYGEDANDVNGKWRVWALTKVGDQWAPQLVSVSTEGFPGNGSDPNVSYDGTRITFNSDDENLWAGDFNSNSDVFVRDLTNKSTTLVSLGAGGWQADANIVKSHISADGRYVSWQAVYKGDDTQVWPDNATTNSNMMVADLDPDGNGKFENTSMKVNQVAHPNPSAKDRSVNLVGVVTYQGWPHALYQLTSTSGGSYLYNLNSGQLLSLAATGALRISPDGKQLTNGMRSYTLNEPGAVSEVFYTDIDSIRSSAPIHSRLAVTDRTFVSYGEGTSAKSIEIESGFDAATSDGGFSSNSVRDESYWWKTANPSSTLPRGITRESVYAQLSWLNAASLVISKQNQGLKHKRGDAGVPRPVGWTDDSTSNLPADRRTTVDDIDELEQVLEEIEKATEDAEKLLENLNMYQMAVLCGDDKGQWCGSTMAATSSYIASEIIMVVTNNLLAKDLRVLAFDTGYNLANGECDSPVQQVDDYAGAIMAHKSIYDARNAGQAASWPVAETIMWEMYGIDRPGCWDQIGLDLDAIRESAAIVGARYPQMPVKFQGLMSTVFAIQADVDKAAAN